MTDFSLTIYLLLFWYNLYTIIVFKSYSKFQFSLISVNENVNNNNPVYPFKIFIVRCNSNEVPLYKHCRAQDDFLELACDSEMNRERTG